MKILHLAEKIYTGTACGACDKYEVCYIQLLEYAILTTYVEPIALFSVASVSKRTTR